MRGTPKLMRLVAVATMALAVAVLLGVCGPAQAQSRQETLIIARNIDDYVTNDVHRTYEYTSQILDTAAYDTLVTVDAPDFTKIQPRLATSWTVSPGRDDVHLQAPARREVHLGQPPDRERRPLLAPPTEEPQGQSVLLHGSDQGHSGGG